MKNVIILMGRKRSGKDTYFNELSDELNGEVKNVKFARKIKAATFDIFGDTFDNDDIKEEKVLIDKDKFDNYLRNNICGIFENQDLVFIDELIKAVFEEYKDKDNKYYISSREFQQKYGTEFCRSIDNDIFTNDGINNIFNEDDSDHNYKLYCVSDGRFKNEINLVAQACKKNNANLEIVYILRYINDNNEYKTVNNEYNKHQSEYLNNKIELLSLKLLNNNNQSEIKDFLKANFNDTDVRIIAREWQNEYNPDNPSNEFDLINTKNEKVKKNNSLSFKPK